MLTNKGVAKNTMPIYTGLKLSQSICDVLGVDSSNVYHLTLECSASDIARVTVYQYAETDEGELHQFADIIKHYEVREVK